MSNHLIAHFSMIDSFSLHKLHSNYCMSMFGCELYGTITTDISTIYICCMAQSYKEIVQTSIQNS